MEELIHSFLTPMPLAALLAIIAVSLLTLSKGADLLIDEAPQHLRHQQLQTGAGQ